MSPRKTLRALVPALTLMFALAGGQAVAAPAPTSHPAKATHTTAAPKVLTYDTSDAGKYADAMDKGAAVWNDSVKNVELKPAQSGQQANVVIKADDGWPRTVTPSLGNGTIYFGQQAVDEGYDTTRIAAHELGHILGLPDMKPGPCSSLMSGASAGADCTNHDPNADEKAEVDKNFKSAFTKLMRTPQRHVYLR